MTIHATAARLAARTFHREVIQTDRQWTVADVEGYLPRGWVLDDDTVDSDFFPVTVENITQVIRARAIQND